MNCYVCEKSVRKKGVRYGVRPAIGICHHCGVGLCIEHGHKTGERGAPLLCRSCAELAAEHGEAPVHVSEKVSMAPA